MLRTLLAQGRKLDAGNARTDSLGADFGRLGLSFIDDIEKKHPDASAWLSPLDAPADFRNAIGHGSETRIAALEAGGGIKATKASYRQHRTILNKLAGTMDEVVGTQLATLLGVTRPW
jgi:hypothetical protein